MASRKPRINAEPEKMVRWYQKLRDKYRLILLNEDTFEEKLSFSLSRLNVFVVTGMLAIILVFLTIYLIAFTPLKEFIPGYSDTNIQKELYELQIKADSLENAVRARSLYINNMQMVLRGDNPEEPMLSEAKTDSMKKADYSGIGNKKIREDTLLRAEYEAQNRYNIKVQGKDDPGRVLSLSKLNFFTPLKGLVMNKFNASQQHFGVDVAAARNEAVKATYDGTVIFSEWTAGTGHVIAVQHAGNVISIYKHNSVLLRRQGDFVRAGESIAIVGESGEFTTGPHLHFELWINGAPVNPENYMIF